MPTAIPAREPIMVIKSIGLDMSECVPSLRISLVAATPIHEPSIIEIINKDLSLCVRLGIFIGCYLSTFFKKVSISFSSALITRLSSGNSPFRTSSANSLNPDIRSFCISCFIL